MLAELIAKLIDAVVIIALLLFFLGMARNA